jgi:hypothetical protein
MKIANLHPSRQKSCHHQKQRRLLFPVFIQMRIYYSETPIKSTYHTSLKNLSACNFYYLVFVSHFTAVVKVCYRTRRCLLSGGLPPCEGRSAKGNISHTISCILCSVIFTTMSTPTQQNTKAKGKFPISSALLTTSYTELRSNKC